MRSICLTLWLCVSVSAADSWPQWGGPSRNFRVPDETIDTDWSGRAPEVLWRREMGDGYSGIAVDERSLYVLSRDQDDERIEALDPATGKTTWSHQYAAPFHENTDLSPGPGPHATPLLCGPLVVAAGVTGKLHALQRTSGTVVWQHAVVEEWGGTINFRGYSSSPTGFQDMVLVDVGGDGQTVIALDQETGEVRWKSQDYATSHVSSTVVEIDQQSHYVCVAQHFVFALNPLNGEKLWEFDHGIDGGHVCSTPGWDGSDNLFLSAAYGKGSLHLQVQNGGGSSSLNEGWRQPRLRVHHSNVLVQDGMLVASSGDFGAIVYSAADAETGEMIWQERSIGRASQLLLGNAHLLLEEDGRLRLVSVSREGVNIRESFALPEGRYWTPPSIVGGVLYVRNREEVMALRLR